MKNGAGNIWERSYDTWWKASTHKFIYKLFNQKSLSALEEWTISFSYFTTIPSERERKEIRALKTVDVSKDTSFRHHRTLNPAENNIFTELWHGKKLSHHTQRRECLQMRWRLIEILWLSIFYSDILMLKKLSK